MTKTNSLTIGITMRVTHPLEYLEPRDTIAQDWSRYMLSNFKDEKWLFLPNLEKDIIAYVERFKINAFILSGGENIGISPKRDETERALLIYAQHHKLPVIAICRGLQMVYDFFGGEIIEGKQQFKKDHIANRHIIYLENEAKEVNSYHGNFLDEKSFPIGLKVIARSACENSIEAIQHQNILGIMWHPEREYPNHFWETQLIKKFLNKKI